jgi:hypothetical protein
VSGLDLPVCILSESLTSYEQCELLLAQTGVGCVPVRNMSSAGKPVGRWRTSKQNSLHYSLTHQSQFLLRLQQRGTKCFEARK